MDPIVLRVAARVATRPIPLDKDAIKKLADELAGDIADYARRQPQDELLGRESHILDFKWIAKTVKGEDIDVGGVVFSEPFPRKELLVTGAHVRALNLWDDDLDAADVRLGLRLNGSLPYSAFTDGESEGTNGLRWHLYNSLVHELTHVAEWRYIQKNRPVQETDVRHSPEAAKAYYNSPHEVRAFMQQIVEEIMPKARSFRRIVEPHNTHNFVIRLLGTSQKWKQIQPHLTPESEAKILKAVYNALDKAGLV